MQRGCQAGPHAAHRARRRCHREVPAGMCDGPVRNGYERGARQPGAHASGGAGVAGWPAWRCCSQLSASSPGPCSVPIPRQQRRLRRSSSPALRTRFAPVTRSGRSRAGLPAIVILDPSSRLSASTTIYRVRRLPPARCFSCRSTVPAGVGPAVRESSCVILECSISRRRWRWRGGPDPSGLGRPNPGGHGAAAGNVHRLH